MEAIAQFVQCRNKSFTIQLRNLTRQLCSIDCGQYALATMTCLATGVDPTCVIFDQDEPQPHLVNILEQQAVSALPIKRSRRPAADAVHVKCEVHCYGRPPDDGGGMTRCDQYQEWFHLKCNSITIDTSLSLTTWYCSECILVCD